MGVLELIQQKAFLGREFMTWLWFRAERDGMVQGRPQEPAVGIELLGPVLLDAQYGDARVSTLKGESPATSPEARTALLEGKKLRRARMRMEREGVEWVLTVDGETFAVSGLGVPNPGRMPFADSLAIRASMLFDLERTLGGLFDEFVRLRLDAAQWTVELDAIHDWVRKK